jgi:hypothetical protein
MFFGLNFYIYASQNRGSSINSQESYEDLSSSFLNQQGKIKFLEKILDKIDKINNNENISFPNIIDGIMIDKDIQSTGEKFINAYNTRQKLENQIKIYAESFKGKNNKPKDEKSLDVQTIYDQIKESNNPSKKKLFDDIIDKITILQLEINSLYNNSTYESLTEKNKQKILENLPSSLNLLLNKIEQISSTELSSLNEIAKALEIFDKFNHLNESLEKITLENEKSLGNKWSEKQEDFNKYKDYYTTLWKMQPFVQIMKNFDNYVFSLEDLDNISQDIRIYNAIFEEIATKEKTSMTLESITNLHSLSQNKDQIQSILSRFISQEDNYDSLSLEKLKFSDSVTMIEEIFAKTKMNLITEKSNVEDEKFKLLEKIDIFSKINHQEDGDYNNFVELFHDREKAKHFLEFIQLNLKNDNNENQSNYQDVDVMILTTINNIQTEKADIFFNTDEDRFFENEFIQSLLNLLDAYKKTLIIEKKNNIQNELLVYIQNPFKQKYESVKEEIEKFFTLYQSTFDSVVENYKQLQTESNQLSDQLSNVYELKGKKENFNIKNQLFQLKKRDLEQTQTNMNQYLEDIEMLNQGTTIDAIKNEILAQINQEKTQLQSQEEQIKTVEESLPQLNNLIKDKISLEGIVAEKIKEIDVLKIGHIDEIQKLKEANKALENDNIQLNRIINSKTGEITTLQKKNHEIAKIADTNLIKNNEQARIIEDQEEQIQKLEDAKAAEAEKLKELSEKIEEHTKALEAEQKKFADEQDKQKKALETQKTGLEDQHKKELEGVKAETEKKLKDQEEQTTALEATYKTAEAEAKQKLEEAQKKLENQATKITDQEKALEAEKNKYKQELLDKEEEKKKELAEAKQKLEEAQKKLADQATKITDQETALEAEHKKALEDEKRLKEAAELKLQETERQLKDKTSQLTTKETKIVDQNKQIQDQAKKITEQAKTIGDKNTELLAKEAEKKKELSDQEAKIKELETQKTSLEAAHKKALEDKISELKQKETKIGDQEKELEEERLKLNDKEKALEDKNTELLAKEAEKTSLEAAHEKALEDKISELKQKETTITGQETKITEQARIIGGKEKELLEKEDKHQKALAEEKQKLADQEKELKRITDELNSLKSLQTTPTNEKDLLIQQRETTIVDQNKQIQDQATKITDQEKTIGDQEINIRNLNDQKGILKSDKQTIQQQLNDERLQLTDKEQVINNQLQLIEDQKKQIQEQAAKILNSNSSTSIPLVYQQPKNLDDEQNKKENQVLLDYKTQLEESLKKNELTTEDKQKFQEQLQQVKAVLQNKEVILDITGQVINKKSQLIAQLNEEKNKKAKDQQNQGHSTTSLISAMCLGLISPVIFNQLNKNKNKNTKPEDHLLSSEESRVKKEQEERQKKQINQRNIDKAAYKEMEKHTLISDVSSSTQQKATKNLKTIANKMTKNNKSNTTVVSIGATGAGAA